MTSRIIGMFKRVDSKFRQLKSPLVCLVGIANACTCSEQWTTDISLNGDVFFGMKEIFIVINC